MQTYEDEFREALTRTQQIGIFAPSIQLTEQRFIDQAAVDEIENIIKTFGSIRDVTDLAHRCLAVNLILLPHFQKLFPAACLTIGYVDQYRGEEKLLEYGRFSQDDIDRWIRAKQRLSSFNGHVWITLPSMEIIDITLFTTLATIRGASSGYGYMIMKHPLDLQGGLAFHPMIVGEEFLHRVGAIGLND